jgi:hypothetical protein
MAVQQLAKDQAKREKKNQKDLDKKFQEDEENALKDVDRMQKLMERIYKKPPKFGAPLDLKPGPGGPVLEAKRGGQVKCGVQMKGTSPLIKKRKGK